MNLLTGSEKLNIVDPELLIFQEKKGDINTLR